MDSHLEDIRDALRTFAKDGTPCTSLNSASSPDAVIAGVSTIRTAQSHTQSGLHNLSTVVSERFGELRTPVIKTDHS